MLKKGISGGERKRTSIGVEIVTDPALIILDGMTWCDPRLELTSGLDSFTAFTIVKVMKDISRKGKTVIAIVNQPSTDIFETFDRIYLLAAGREVYQGDTLLIYDYFKRIGREIPAYTNPADQLIKLMHAKEDPDPEDIKQQSELFDSYDTNLRKNVLADVAEQTEKAAKLDDSKLAQFRDSSFGLQFKQLLGRSFKNVVRNPTLTRVRVLQMIALAILMDLIFWNKESYERGDVKDKNGAIFFILTSQFMLAVQSVLLTCMCGMLNG